MIINVFQKFFVQVGGYLINIKPIKLSEIFKGWSVFELGWLILSVVLLGLISIFTTEQYVVLTTIATVTGMVNIFLVAKGKILNYFFAFINNLTYAYVCYAQGVYGQFLLFICFFFPIQFYGLYNWTKPENISQNNSIVTNILNTKQRILLIFSIIVLSALYGVFVLKGYFNQEVGLVADSLTGVLSVLAIILMVKAYIEQWVLWIIINILSTIIWLQQYFYGTGNGIAFFAMWLIYLVNSIYGYINWHKLRFEVP
ncbi:nicotinamide mononucleotide transporter [Allofrancisella guangzhouensis]|uniref:Nicotinamide riboside transporter PnuC n=1 Tax=Allofrancisella guangzhouensis TaxID=594679 RepID=A0A0A8E583_9GAMM|nr:nicotinamide riboside transporter PnuC [Allofrancisella guangzhouensis]AJC48767.1 nicotinamide mononucleotide transporter [Allofrancisella guangzhouensis]MBK2027345.1 nicotinamide mononucleotide transporter [Allofrancisella guangzhouensis]MBK2044767.1 nicotinamide mononucleotide transporter [Allofrancisella guangzhouensis]MBK2045239.1 nicotinamide mononucleotide transporter [Allofrancisella guangzhouensis]